MCYLMDRLLRVRGSFSLTNVVGWLRFSTRSEAASLGMEVGQAVE